MMVPFDLTSRLLGPLPVNTHRHPCPYARRSNFFRLSLPGSYPEKISLRRVGAAPPLRRSLCKDGPRRAVDSAETQMKKMAIALAGLLLCGCSAFAADGNARQLFQRIDANGDRKLEFSEIQAMRAQMFDRMDVNRNGVLDPGEVQAAMERVQSKRDVQTARFADLQAEAKRMDRNGDGKISREEFTAAIPDRLLQADINGDGALSIAEMRALRHQ